MNKIILPLLALLSLSSVAQQIDNSDFELWENVGTPTEEPTNFSSLKTADNLAGSAPQVLTQDTGNNGTGFSARLEVKSVFGIAANGIMTNGRVHAEFNPDNGYVFSDLNNADWNQAFTAKPDSLIGYFKYAPVGGDKGKVEVVLHENDGRLPVGSTAANKIAGARMDFTAAEASWKRFSVPFSYLDERTPQYLLITVTSGDSTISNNGSVLWVDDFELIYNESSTNSLTENELGLNVVAQNGTITIHSNTEQGTFSVVSMTGQVIKKGNVKDQKINLKPGVYIVTVSVADGILRKKVYVD